MLPTIDMKATGIHLRAVFNEKGITVRTVQEYLGLASVQAVYHWFHGISLPSIDNLYALSELLNMPMDDLIIGNRQSLK